MACAASRLWAQLHTDRTEGTLHYVTLRCMQVLWESHGVHVVRRSLTALHTLARLAPMAGAHPLAWDVQ